MSALIYIVDAFTKTAFKGNPAAVYILDHEIDNTRMQAIAAEINLSETAFILKENEAFRLRWFTPTTEVDLCGHATLASAHILYEQKIVSENSTISFFTRSGLLKASKAKDKIKLDFPEEKPIESGVPENLVEALGTQPVWVGKNRFDYLVEIDNAETLRSLRPDFNKLAAIPARGIIVTAKSDITEYHFLSRFFCPNVGINEDPVTGSAHCALSPYWTSKLDKSELIGYQCSPRGGKVEVCLKDSRVELIGEAITVMKNELFL